MFHFLFELSDLISPSCISIFTHDILEAMLDVILLKLHAFEMDDGGMLEVGLQTLVKFCRYRVEFVLDRLEYFTTFGSIHEDKTAALIILVEIRVGLLPSPEVCYGNVAWASGIAEVAFSAAVAEHDMLIENVCEIHFIPPPNVNVSLCAFHPKRSLSLKFTIVMVSPCFFSK